ncbi:MAG: hypothetical protein E7314_06560 [Clostridiales bacterium]|nr:hypothetical protein [Clostridiales bacterium]
MNIKDKIIANHMNIFGITKVGKKRLYKAMEERDKEFLDKVYYSRNTPVRICEEIKFFWSVKPYPKEILEALNTPVRKEYYEAWESEEVRKRRYAIAQNHSIPKEFYESWSGGVKKSS